MKSRIYARKKSTREQTPDFSTAPAQPMFQSRSFVVQTQQAEQSPQQDLKTALRRAECYGHHLGRMHPAGVSAATAVQPMLSAKAPQTLQAKLTVGAAGDKYEQEADAVADRVVDRIHEGGESTLAQKPAQSKSVQDSKQKSSQPSDLNIQPLVQRESAGGVQMETPQRQKMIEQKRGEVQPLSDVLQKKGPNGEAEPTNPSASVTESSPSSAEPQSGENQPTSEAKKKLDAVFQELSEEGLKITQLDITQYHKREGDKKIARIPLDRLTDIMRRRVQQGTEAFKKKDKSDKQKANAAAFEQTDEIQIEKAREAASQIREIITQLPEEAKANDLLKKIQQACRASTPKDLEAGLPGHLYELISQYKAMKSGATLKDATGKADTLYEHPEEGLVATQNKWVASENSMGRNITAALRQLAGKHAHGTSEINKNSEVETPPKEALRVAEVAVPEPGPKTEEDRKKLKKNVTDIYNQAVTELGEDLRGRRNEIRIVYINSQEKKTERYTFTTDDKGEEMRIKAEPPVNKEPSVNKEKGKGVVSGEEVSLQDIPRWIEAFKEISVKQRLDFLNGK